VLCSGASVAVPFLLPGLLSAQGWSATAGGDKWAKGNDKWAASAAPKEDRYRIEQVQK
jgi:hypothetical protein